MAENKNERAADDPRCKVCGGAVDPDNALMVGDGYIHGPCDRPSPESADARTPVPAMCLRVCSLDSERHGWLAGISCSTCGHNKDRHTVPLGQVLCSECPRTPVPAKEPAWDVVKTWKLVCAVCGRKFPSPLANADEIRRHCTPNSTETCEGSWAIVTPVPNTAPSVPAAKEETRRHRLAASDDPMRGDVCLDCGADGGQLNAQGPCPASVPAADQPLQEKESHMENGAVPHEHTAEMIATFNAEGRCPICVHSMCNEFKIDRDDVQRLGAFIMDRYAGRFDPGEAIVDAAIRLLTPAAADQPLYDSAGGYEYARTPAPADQPVKETERPNTYCANCGSLRDYCERIDLGRHNEQTVRRCCPACTHAASTPSAPTEHAILSELLRLRDERAELDAYEKIAQDEAPRNYQGEREDTDKLRLVSKRHIQNERDEKAAWKCAERFRIAAAPASAPIAHPYRERTADGKEFIATPAAPAPAPAPIDGTWPTAERLIAAIRDIDAHATPYGSDDDEGQPHAYLVTRGALHRALGVAEGRATAAPCPCLTAPAPIEKIAEEILCLLNHGTRRSLGVQCDSTRFGQHQSTWFRQKVGQISELIRRHFTDEKKP